MGSGKSSLGIELAHQLNYSFLDTDKMIEGNEGITISEIFNLKSEDYFRVKEHQLIYQLQLVSRSVIATGGGMPCFNNNMELLNKLGTTIWLNVDEDVLIERVRQEATDRPLLKNSANLEKNIHELLHKRTEFYLQAKHEIKNPTTAGLIQLLKHEMGMQKS